MTARLVRGTALASKYSWLIGFIVYGATKFRSLQQIFLPTVLQVCIELNLTEIESSLSIAPTATGILSTRRTKMINPGTMIPDTKYPIFSITDSPPNIAGTTHLLTLILESYKHVALFIIADHALHPPHPLFEKFMDMCSPYRQNLRMVIIARTYRIGGLRKPDWSNDDILFLATNTGATERVYGLNGKKEMGLIIVRPDGYVGYSTLIDLYGNAFGHTETWLSENLL